MLVGKAEHVYEVVRLRKFLALVVRITKGMIIFYPAIFWKATREFPWEISFGTILYGSILCLESWAKI